MRFVCRADRATYVVKRYWHSVEDGERVLHRGLRAKFFGGVFDSERAQKALGWTDADRKLVEQTLLNHEDFGRHPGGIHLESVADGEQHPGIVPDASRLRCISFFRNEAGEAEQCPEQAVNGDYCKQHTPTPVEEVVQEIADEAEMVSAGTALEVD